MAIDLKHHVHKAHFQRVESKNEDTKEIEGKKVVWTKRENLIKPWRQVGIVYEKPHLQVYTEILCLIKWNAIGVKMMRSTREFFTIFLLILLQNGRTLA